MDAYGIATRLLYYWRFKRRYFYIATEAGNFWADVLVSDGETEIIECEVKISISDLKADWNKKKHKVYLSNEPDAVPNKMYYAVPSELVKDTIEEIDDYPYGVIEVFDLPITLKRRKKGKLYEYCSIRKRAKVIREDFNDDLFEQLIQRNSSEILRLRLGE